MADVRQRRAHDLLVELDAVIAPNAPHGEHERIFHEIEPSEFRDLRIGVVLASRVPAWHDHPYWGPVARGVRSRLVRAGCDLLTYCVYADTDRADPLRRSFADVALEEGVDGIVVASLPPDDPDVALAIERGIPAVVIDDDSAGSRAGSVQSDNAGGMDALVAHLVDRGRTRLAHVAGYLGARPAIHRLEAFRAAVERAGLACPKTYLEGGDWHHRTGYEAAQRLMALPEPPDAILASCDIAAVGVLAALEDAGVRVPDDVAVTGFDGSELAERTDPPLTTVTQDLDAIAGAAVSVILRMIERPDLSPPAVTVPVELVVRASSG
jgi:LacI family transcriptional regulator